MPDFDALKDKYEQDRQELLPGEKKEALEIRNGSEELQAGAAPTSPVIQSFEGTAAPTSPTLEIPSAPPVPPMPLVEPIQPAPPSPPESPAPPAPSVQKMKEEAPSDPDIHQLRNRLLAVVEKQETLNRMLEQKLQRIEERLVGLDALEKGMEDQAARIDSLTQAAQKAEKANTDILRDSKNYQATVQNALQKELEGYRKKMSETAMAPILTEISNLYITVHHLAEHLEDGKTKKNIEDGVLESIEEILEDNGVTICTTAAGKERSVTQCKTIKTVPTHDRALHGRVARSYHPSFTLGKLVLVKERIDTYVYEEPAPTVESPPGPPATELSAEGGLGTAKSETELETPLETEPADRPQDLAENEAEPDTGVAPEEQREVASGTEATMAPCEPAENPEY